MSAVGARYPNAIEKQIVVTGEAAISVAELLGLSAPTPSVSLQLGRNDAWAVYLLKQDTKERLWNDNEGCPARYNTVAFSTEPVPSLTISPFWLDLSTRYPNRNEGSYSFHSPWVFENDDRNDPWAQLLRRLMGGAGWCSTTKQNIQCSYRSSEGNAFFIRVYSSKNETDQIEKYRYLIEVEAHTGKA